MGQTLAPLRSHTRAPSPSLPQRRRTSPSLPPFLSAAAPSPLPPFLNAAARASCHTPEFYFGMWTNNPKKIIYISYISKICQQLDNSRTLIIEKPAFSYK
jgi:hypothetical protein